MKTVIKVYFIVSESKNVVIFDELLISLFISSWLPIYIVIMFFIESNPLDIIFLIATGFWFMVGVFGGITDSCRYINWKTFDKADRAFNLYMNSMDNEQ